MILPRLNAFVVLKAPNQGDLMVWGRVIGVNLDARAKQCVLNVMTGPGVMDTCPCPPWRLIHCHHQPVLEYITVDGKRYRLPAADDSLAWRLTREAVARAMTDFRKYDEEPDRGKEDA